VALLWPALTGCTLQETKPAGTTKRCVLCLQMVGERQGSPPLVSGRQGRAKEKKIGLMTIVFCKSVGTAQACWLGFGHWSSTADRASRHLLDTANAYLYTYCMYRSYDQRRTVLRTAHTNKSVPFRAERDEYFVRSSQASRCYNICPLFARPG
jgi:hypothetical protein